MDKISEEKKLVKNIFNKCKIISITNTYIIKLIFKYQNTTNALQIVKINKSLQKKIGLSLTTFKIFHFYKKNKINMFDFKKVIKFTQNIKSKLKEFSSLNEIYYNLSLCMINDFYKNKNLKKNNANIIDINIIYNDLYLLYSSLLLNFSSLFKINLFFSDKFFIDKIYLNKYFQNFINKNISFINGISLEIYDKNIIKSIIDNKFFINDKLLYSSYNINRIKFSKIKFSKDEIQLIKYFSGHPINEICFFSCKFTLYCIELLSRFFNKEKTNINKITFNDCHINNHAIEKLIYWHEKDKEYSFIKSILSNLVQLDLSCNKVTDFGFNQLLLYYNSSNVYISQKLYYLNLSNNKLKSESIKYLLNKNNYTINNNNNNESIFKNVDKVEHFIGLTYLDLSHNPLGDIAKLIFSWKNKTLTHLILNDCSIRNITYDNCNSNYINIDEDDIQSTSENEKEKKFDIEYYDEENITLGLNKLLYLNISENQLTSKFLKFLFYNIPTLYTIFISSCYLENSSFNDIINMKKETNIKNIIFSHNQLDTQTIISMYENNILKNVKELDLFDNILRDEFVPYLIQKKPNIKLKKINIDLNFGIQKENNSLLYKNYMKYTK